jgi:hypothetical protein
MLNAHFESKFNYSQEDARKDATLLLNNTEDKGYESLLFLNDQQKIEVRDYSRKLRKVQLGNDIAAQVLAVSSTAVSTVDDIDVNIPFIQTLPRKVYPTSFMDNKDSKNYNTGGLSANVLKQTRKDIERDRVIINGQFVIGAEVGISHIENLVYNHIESTILDHNPDLLKKMNLEIYDGKHMPNLHNLAQRALGKATRTNSGGTSFVSLQALLNPETEQALPLSDLAMPLCIRIGISALPLSQSANISNEIGIGNPELAVKCEVDCVTYFRIQPVDMNMGFDTIESAANTNSTSSSTSTSDELNGVNIPVNTTTTPFSVKLSFVDSVYLKIHWNEDGTAHLGETVYDSIPIVFMEKHEEKN